MTHTELFVFLFISIFLFSFYLLKVAPAELEGLLVTHEAIADAAVIGVVNEEAGEFPKAYIVKKPGKSIDPKDIVAWVKGECVAFKSTDNIE